MAAFVFQGLQDGTDDAIRAASPMQLGLWLAHLQAKATAATVKALARPVLDSPRRDGRPATSGGAPQTTHPPRGVQQPFLPFMLAAQSHLLSLYCMSARDASAATAGSSVGPSVVFPATFHRPSLLPYFSRLLYSAATVLDRVLGQLDSDMELGASQAVAAVLNHSFVAALVPGATAALLAVPAAAELSAQLVPPLASVLHSLDAVSARIGHAVLSRQLPWLPDVHASLCVLFGKCCGALAGDDGHPAPTAEERGALRWLDSPLFARARCIPPQWRTQHAAAITAGDPALVPLLEALAWDGVGGWLGAMSSRRISSLSQRDERRADRAGSCSPTPSVGSVAATTQDAASPLTTRRGRHRHTRSSGVAVDGSGSVHGGGGRAAKPGVGRPGRPTHRSRQGLSRRSKSASRW